MKVIKIDNIDQVSELIWEQKFDFEKKRNRSSYLYRGLSNAKFNLVTSLQRNCKGKKDELELSILRNFTKYTAKEEPKLKESIWRQMIVGQHHGLPTRLLDWSYSVLVALHFATSGESLNMIDDHDCAVWKIDIEEINGMLPDKYKKILKTENAYLLTVDMMDRLISGDVNALEKYDKEMGEHALVLLEPFSIDQRIINQYSYFSIIPAQMEHGTDSLGIEAFLSTTNNTVKYVIDKSLKWRIRDMLDQMNINERTIYPGIDGIAHWFARHYYVR